MSRVEVKNIEIKIGKKVIHLLPDEAKELRDVLNEAFPEQYPFPQIQGPYVPPKSIPPRPPDAWIRDEAYVDTGCTKPTVTLNGNNHD